MSERYPDIQLEVKHGKSPKILTALINNQLDAIFYNESVFPKANLSTIKIGEFGVFLVAPTGLINKDVPFDWQILNQYPWINPNPQTCCGIIAQTIFTEHNISPKRLIQVDTENMLSLLICNGLGLGLLHSEAAQVTKNKGKIDILYEVKSTVPVYFAYQSKRHLDLVIEAAFSLMEELIA